MFFFWYCLVIIYYVFYKKINLKGLKKSMNKKKKICVCSDILLEELIYLGDYFYLICLKRMKFWEYIYMNFYLNGRFMIISIYLI